MSRITLTAARIVIIHKFLPVGGVEQTTYFIDYKDTKDRDSDGKRYINFADKMKDH